MVKYRKLLAYVMIFLLVFSSFQFGFATNSSANVSKQDQLRNALEKSVHEKVEDVKEEALHQFSATDKVRVIVELTGETPIEYATKQGVLYKELSESTKTSLFNKAVSLQESVKTEIASKGVALKEINSFNTVFNGFSGEVAYGDIAKIEALSSVSKVYLSNEYYPPEPQMNTSHGFIQSALTWGDAKFKGEGMIVAVIDSGIDPSHKDFVLSEDTEFTLTKELVNSLVAEKGLKGKFFTDKVPYGYNYYDKNQQVLDLNAATNDHGMHVAGTVVANGEIFGVAPEAQVLGMKVFSNDPVIATTWSDIYLVAIDEAIKLGADVLNMSLGSTASFYEPESPEDLAITRAVENGIVSSVSAGNSGHIGYGFWNPLFQNPDIGLVGAPGLNRDTIQVAASGNVGYLYQHTISVEGNDDFTAVGYGMDSWEDLEGAELVSLGGKLGHPGDYQGVDVAGKVVVMPRGALTFFDKTKNAAEAGAIGIVVYNHDANAFFWENQGGWHIPFMKIQVEDGAALEAALEAGGTTLEVEELKRSEDPEFGRMTEFTSWGTTPSLELKPELTAPGGNINSTMSNNEYAVKSGTSMAAPHVAGGAALVQQYLKTDERFTDLSAGDRTRLAKVLLMNTGKVINDLNDQPFSPRRQGAGMMQTFSAVDTPVYVVSKETNEGKVELYDFESKVVSFTLTATNISDKSVKYDVDVRTLTDTFAVDAYGDDINALIAGDFEGVKVTAPATVTVPVGDSVDFTVTLDLTNAKIPGLGKLQEDIFVEGFVTLTDEKGIEAELSVPFLGFYGKWDRPSILDGLGFFGETKYYGLPGDMVSTLDGGLYLTPVLQDGDEKYYAINPNVNAGYFTNIRPYISFLRNAKEVQFNVLSEDEKSLRTILLQQNVRKNFINGGSGSPVSNIAARTWDGTVNNKTVEDGKYYYEIKGKVDYAGAEWQSYKFPVVVDSTGPEINATIQDKVLTWNVEDAGVGVDIIGVFLNGNLVLATEDTEGTLDMEIVDSASLIEIAAFDRVGNYSEKVASLNDSSLPSVVVGQNTPVLGGYYSSYEVPVAGYATDNVKVASVTINGVEADLTYAEGRYYFDTVATFTSEGEKDIIVTATDLEGNEFSINRSVNIDTTAPTLEVQVPKFVDQDVEEVTATFQLKDNNDYLSLSINGSQEFLQANYRGVPTSVTVESTLPLQLGNNTFHVVLTDAAGLTTVKEVNVYRNESESRVDRVSGPSRYDTAVELSKAGWETSDVVVIARGDDYADALAGVPLAKKHDAPLLLTGTKSLPAVTKAEIARLGAKTVFVLGGTGAVSKEVEAALKAEGVTVKRISGPTRYATAAAIAFEVAPQGADNGVVVVNGTNFPDALSVASYAAQNGMPILLTNGKALPQHTQSALIGLAPKKSIVVGGTLAVSNSELASLPNPTRIGGKNRYETALNVVKHFNNDADHFYVATGRQFADALAGAASAAKDGTGMLLVSNTVPAEVEAFVKGNGVETLTVVGGTLAVSDEVYAKLVSLLK